MHFEQMLAHINNLLRHLFIDQIGEIKEETQVRFQPPDEEWRNYVSNLNDKNALNVYLVDLRENRKLRSNDRTRQVEQGIVNEIPAPRRMDCHYLITAWSPAKATPAIEPTIDEHAILYNIVGVLMNNEPLIPREIYKPAQLPAGFPEAIADAELPISVLPAEGFPKLAEFWGTMNWRWKPAVYLIVTVPVILDKQISGPMVTTRITEYRQSNKPETAETWIQIAGIVTDKANNPVAGAWVQLEALSGEPIQTTTTVSEKEQEGQFTFAKLQAGTYQLRVRAMGHVEPAPRKIEVPSPTGNYDVQLN